MHASFNAYALNPIYYIVNLLVDIHQLESGSSTIMALGKKQVQQPIAYGVQSESGEVTREYKKVATT